MLIDANRAPMTHAGRFGLGVDLVDQRHLGCL